MGQIQLFSHPRHPGPVVLAYGGGVNTIAAMVLMERQQELLKSRGQWIQAITMSDPGDENPLTYKYRDEVATPWLLAHGLPGVTTVSRKSEAPFRPRAHLTLQGTLREECLRIKALPSIAYGYKKCSLKYKATPQAWWIERQPWAQEHWKAGGKITRIIGYDTDEPERALSEFTDPVEARRYGLFYILLEGGYDRAGCEKLILSAGLPLPPKSSCKWCPSKQIWEWRQLWKEDRQGWLDAQEMEDNAEIDQPDVVGLVRVNPHGKRQLRVLGQQFEMEEASGAVCSPGEDDTSAMPCDCSL